MKRKVSTTMNIEERISLIMKKMEKLKEKLPEIPLEWNPPLSEKVVENYEKQNRIKIPKDYRKFVTTVAESGTQPFYGLYSMIRKLPAYEVRPKINEKFPYTVRKPLNIYELSDEEYESIFKKETINVDAGYILLATEGCGMNSILIVNTDDEETYGTVWYYDLANDAGIYPIINPKSGSPMCFLDWLEYFAEKEYELSEEDFWSYGELAGKVE